MADSDALRTRRSRQHKAGDHALCLPGRCTVRSAAPRDVPGDTGVLERAVLAEFDGPDEMSRALALRLVELAGGPGVGGVQAVRALAELIASQREYR